MVNKLLRGVYKIKWFEKIGEYWYYTLACWNESPIYNKELVMLDEDEYLIMLYRSTKPLVTLTIHLNDKKTGLEIDHVEEEHFVVNDIIAIDKKGRIIKEEPIII